MASLANRVDSTSCVHQNRGHQFINLLSNAYLNGVVPQSLFNASINRLLLRRLQQSTKDCVVETNGYNMVALNQALEKLPNVRIIHVVRDPRSFVTSMTNWRGGRPVRNAIQENLPFWDVSPSLLKIPRSKWSSLTVKDKFCHRWVYKNNYIRSNYSNDERYRIVRFEDLFDKNKAETSVELLNWGGLELTQTQFQNFINKKINASNGSLPIQKQNKDWNDWSDSDCKQLKEISETTFIMLRHATNH